MRSQFGQDFRSQTRLREQDAKEWVWPVGQASGDRHKITVGTNARFIVCVLLLAAIAPEVRRAPAQWDEAAVGYKFTLGRIRYASGDLWQFGREPMWRHDWPRGEQHLMKILSEVTRIDVNPEGKVVSLETEEIFKYPISYLCEVGFMDLTEAEVENLREYLLRGGFLIVDDFRGQRALSNFMHQMTRVFPDRSLELLPRSHPIFHCFYDISNIFPPPHPDVYGRLDEPEYLGMNDDDDRLMMVVDYNNDLMEYWEYSDNPLRPIEETNEAYKYGVNYVMYALTH